MNNEIIGADLVAERKLFVAIGRNRTWVEVSTMQAASDVYMNYIAELENDGICGASVTPACSVRNDKEQIARVSYNGRVWQK